LESFQTLLEAVHKALYVGILRLVPLVVNSQKAFITFEYRKTYIASHAWNFWAHLLSGALDKVPKQKRNPQQKQDLEPDRFL